MSISIEEVDRIAKLSRLSFSADEKQKLQQELSGILAYVDQLKEIEDKGAVENPDPAAMNLMRDDVVTEVNPEDFLAQAPGREGNFVKVKSVLD